MYSALRVCIFMFLAPALVHSAVLENPGNGSSYSGIGVISGWKCSANGPLTVRFNGGAPIPLVYGSERPDVRDAGVCGNADVGFVAIWNWGNLGDGTHTAVVYENGVEFARSTFQVTTLGEAFVRGASGECTIPNFPSSGETATFAWNQNTQHLELVPDRANALTFPLRSIHASGNWANNRKAAETWEDNGKVGPLIPSGYIEWLDSLHVNWVGLSVAMHYDDSMDSTVERVHSRHANVPTFSDDALRQLIREFRSYGIDVYLTLAFESHEAEKAVRPVCRWQLGDPAPPHTGGVPPDDPDTCGVIMPEFWPWRPDHPDHTRFVAEFWETYTQQAIHFAQIAQAEGVRLYSLGTETDRLFRTRSGDYWSNDFSQQLKSMVARVRAVYSGLLTYDMHASAFTEPHFGPGSNHLWEDLELDVVGISAWFPLADMPPSTVLSVASLESSYEQIFQDYLVPLAEKSPSRPIVFTEYGAIDTVGAPSDPGDGSRHEQPFISTDSNGNGLDDGRETQANIVQALINTMDKYPGVLNGAFFWDNWIADDAMWEEYWAGRRNFAIRGKPSEEVVRSAYNRYRQR